MYIRDRYLPNGNTKQVLNINISYKESDVYLSAEILEMYKEIEGDKT